MIGQIFEGQNFETTARLLVGSPAISALQLSDVLPWSFYVYDGKDLVYSLEDIAPSSDNFYGNMQPWDVDDVGWNFINTIPGDAFEVSGGKSYKIYFAINTNGDDTIRFVDEIYVIPVPYE